MRAPPHLIAVPVAVELLERLHHARLGVDAELVEVVIDDGVRDVGVGAGVPVGGADPDDGRPRRCRLVDGGEVVALVEERRVVVEVGDGDVDEEVPEARRRGAVLGRDVELVGVLLLPVQYLRGRRGWVW